MRISLPFKSHNSIVKRSASSPEVKELLSQISNLENKVQTGQITSRKAISQEAVKICQRVEKGSQTISGRVAVEEKEQVVATDVEYIPK